MGNQPSTPKWVDRQYRKKEPALTPVEEAMLVPFETNPKILSSGWVADKTSIAFITFLRSIAPLSYLHLVAWGISAIGGNPKARKMLFKYTPPSMLDALINTFGRIALVVFKIRSTLKNVIKYMIKVFPILNNLTQYHPASVDSRGLASTALTKMAPKTAFASVFSVQGIFERVFNIVVNMLRLVLPSSFHSLLPASPTITVFASMMKWTIRLWCIAECLFYLYFLNRKHHLNKRSIPEDIPPTPAMRRAHTRRLLNHVMTSGKCPILFIREWFNGADFKDIRHQNMREWAAGSFFNKAIEECSRDDILEMDDTVYYIQKATGLQPNKGYNSKVVSLRFTLDPLKVTHKPLIFYTAIYAATKLAGDNLLKSLGFVKYQGPFFSYWHRPATNTTANADAHQYAAKYGGPGGFAADIASESESESETEYIVNTLKTKKNQAIKFSRDQRVQAIRKYTFPRGSTIVDELEEDNGVDVVCDARANPGYSAYSNIYQQSGYESDTEGSDDELNYIVDLEDVDTNGDDSVLEGLRLRTNAFNAEVKKLNKRHTKLRKLHQLQHQHQHQHQHEETQHYTYDAPRGSYVKTPKTTDTDTLSPTANISDIHSNPNLTNPHSHPHPHSQNDNENENLQNLQENPKSSSTTSKSSKSRSKPKRSHLPFNERVKKAEEDDGAIVFVHGIGIGSWIYYPFIKSLIDRYPNKDCFLPELDFVSMRLSEYVPSARQSVAGLRLMLLEQGFNKAVWFGHSYGTFVVGHCLRFESTLVEHVIQIDPVCFLIHQMDGPFQFLFAPPQSTLARLINYIAQTELGVVHTIARRLWWYQSIVWEDHLPSGSAIILSAKDSIVPSASVRHYLQHASHRIRILWFENLPHAGFVSNPVAQHQILDCVAPFRPPKNTKPIPRPVRIPCARPCPSADIASDMAQLIVCALPPPPLTPGPTEHSDSSLMLDSLLNNNSGSGSGSGSVGGGGGVGGGSDLDLDSLTISNTLSNSVNNGPPQFRSCAYVGLTEDGIPYKKKVDPALFAPSPSALSHKRCPTCPITCVSACCVQEFFNPYSPVKIPITDDGKPIDITDLNTNRDSYWCSRLHDKDHIAECDLYNNDNVNFVPPISKHVDDVKYKVTLQTYQPHIKPYTTLKCTRRTNAPMDNQTRCLEAPKSIVLSRTPSYSK